MSGFMRPRPANHAMLGGLLGAPVALLTAPSIARAEKADVVQMSNGDRLICEIQDLDQGRLRVKTDGFGTVFAEWDKVVRIESARRFEVRETSGTLLYGSLKSAPAEGRLVVAAGAGDVELAISRVARIHVLQSGFWDRIEGSLALGGSYTRANGLIQLNPAFDATYVGRGFQAGIDVTATWTRQEDKDDASRAVGALSYTRFRGERWTGLRPADGGTQLRAGTRTARPCLGRSGGIPAPLPPFPHGDRSGTDGLEREGSRAGG
jgi:hypothetical protein